MRLWILAIIVLAFVSELVGQDNVLTFAKAESIACERSPEIKLARYRYEQAKASYLAALNPFLPKLSTYATYSKRQRQFEFAPYQPQPQNWSFGISLSLPSVRSGRNIISYIQADINKKIAELNYRDEFDRLELSLVDAYFAVVEATMSLVIARQSLKRAEKELEFVRKKYELGLASKMDFVRMKVNFAQKKYNLVQAEDALQTARENLCKFLGFPSDSSITVDTSFSLPKVEELPALEVYLARFEQNRAYRQSVLSRRYAQLSNLSSWLDYLPMVTISAGYDWFGSELPSSPSGITNNMKWSYSINFSWQIFGGTSRISSVKSSHASLEMAKIEESVALDDAKRQIRQAYRRLRQNIVSFELATAQLEQAKLLLEAAKKKYDLGSATLLELMDAEMALEQAQIQRVKAIADFHRAKATLKWLCAGNIP